VLLFIVFDCSNVILFLGSKLESTQSVTRSDILHPSSKAKDEPVDENESKLAEHLLKDRVVNGSCNLTDGQVKPEQLNVISSNFFIKQEIDQENGEGQCEDKKTDSVCVDVTKNSLLETGSESKLLNKEECSVIKNGHGENTSKSSSNICHSENDLNTEVAAQSKTLDIVTPACDSKPDLKKVFDENDKESESTKEDQHASNKFDSIRTASEITALSVLASSGRFIYLCCRGIPIYSFSIYFNYSHCVLEDLCPLSHVWLGCCIIIWKSPYSDTLISFVNLPNSDTRISFINCWL